MHVFVIFMKMHGRRYPTTHQCGRTLRHIQTTTELSRLGKMLMKGLSMKVLITTLHQEQYCTQYTTAVFWIG